MFKIILLMLFLTLPAVANAQCANGKCSLRRAPVRSVLVRSAHKVQHFRFRIFKGRHCR